MTSRMDEVDHVVGRLRRRCNRHANDVAVNFWSRLVSESTRRDEYDTIGGTRPDPCVREAGKVLARLCGCEARE